ncbi:glycosyl transferase family protein [Microvirga sp. W0021]|uniref:Glycosyl transferase family protein n=1 Tax=Hohaiivirga grylli TaxID=3133970 RepID=A0ABV0BHQ8_9HYPH
MSLYWPFFIADCYRALEYTIAAMAVLILISSLDDLFIDLWYWVRRIRRALTVERIYKPLQAEQLLERPEQYIAVMLPAWLEYDVIAPMIERMVNTLDYRSYMIFAGTYQNDQATIDEVERMKSRYKQLIRVEVPHDGPTCKADCLNWIVQSIFHQEKVRNITFAGVILHDSEDVLHPLELRFFNYLLPRKDLIQIPVNSLERNWYELVAGVYMDEFAEWHSKDIVVRESMTGMVPSAGVGTCFSRRALLTLAGETDNQPFNTQTLTEDYDIGVRLANHGMKSIIARFMVTYIVKRQTWFGYGSEREYTVKMPLCVREFFPNTFKTSYRQKARWSLGICFQGWEHFGWHGTLADRYLLLRDRKGVVTCFIAIISYILAIQFMLFQLAYNSGWITARYPPLIAFDGWIQWVFWICLAALILRTGQRVYFTANYFGWEHGLLAIPRMIVGNFVNFMAMCRAWKQFLSYLILGKKLVWDKTMHDFPTEEGLEKEHRRLGDLLVEWHAIDPTKLSQALEDQNRHYAPLGRILLSKGWLDETTLAEAIAFQSSLERAVVDEKQLISGRNILPAEILIRGRIVVLGQGKGKHVILGVIAPLNPKILEHITAELGYTPEQRIISESELVAGLRYLTAGNENAASDLKLGNQQVPLLGDIMVEMALANREDIDKQMEIYSPDKDGRIGEFLVSKGVITADALQKAIQEQQRRREHLVS